MENTTRIDARDDSNWEDPFEGLDSDDENLGRRLR